VPADKNRSGGSAGRPGSKRDAARQRIAEKRAAEMAARAREERRRRTIFGGIAAGVVLVIALVVVFAVQSNRTSTSPTAATPKNTVSSGLVIPVGAASSGSSGAAGATSGSTSPVVINLYEDLQCPNCKAFEAQTGSTMAQLVAQGKVVLHYHEMAFLDSSANGNFSTRALNAAAVVTDVAGDQAFQKFHDLIYANQTPETGPGMSDTQLIAYAKQAGASGSAVESAIKDLKYSDWTKKTTDQASKDGVTGTPTVIIGGKQVQDTSPSGITAAVDAAANG
jgi:protein-disulfide isomerase